MLQRQAGVQGWGSSVLEVPSLLLSHVLRDAFRLVHIVTCGFSTKCRSLSRGEKEEVKLHTGLRSRTQSLARPTVPSKSCGMREGRGGEEVGLLLEGKGGVVWGDR